MSDEYFAETYITGTLVENAEIAALREQLSFYQKKVAVLENIRSHSMVDKSVARTKILEILDAVTDGNIDSLLDDQREEINNILISMKIDPIKRPFRLNLTIEFEPLTTEIEVDADDLTDAMEAIEAGLYDEALMNGKQVKIASIKLNGHIEGPREE
jgi:hypothetical protein